jgi:hypothetical protein
MTDDIYKRLKRPFSEKAISWRAGATNAKKNDGKASKCIALAYIDARDVMQRLDDVFGMNWMCKYSHAENKTICELSVLIEDNWITRAGGAGDTDVEAEKGAISDAFKRAAVLFGIGRYLYELDNNWVECDEFKRIVKPPQLPEWATPQGFDTGLTPTGLIFGENRKRILDGIAEEIQNKWSKEEVDKHICYEIWTNAIPEFQINEEQMYAWFLLPSEIRTAIKRIKNLKESSNGATVR